ncbi:MAG TPA: PQQ-binding-like beta-propeller repeat protein [Planctomycetota bacterium]
MDVKDSGKYRSQFSTIGAQAALAVAWVSGLFSLVLCVIVIVNQINIASVDPLDDKSLAALKAAIAKDPENRELRDSVRSLYMMSQRAFFTNQTQMRTGGLLLLGGVAIFLAAIKTLVELRRVNPVPTGAQPMEGGKAERAAARWAVVAGGGVLVVITLTVVWLSDPPIDLDAVPAAPAAAAAEPAPAPAPAPGPVPGPGPAPAVAKPDPAPAPAGLAAVPLHAWPQFRGPNGLAVAGHKSAPLTWNGSSGEGVLWKAEIPTSGTNSPVVWDKKVFVSGSDEKKLEVYAYDVDKGALLWTGEVPNTLDKPLKVMEGTTYAASTLATDGARVYAIFATGDLAAFTLDGKRLWAKSLGLQKNSYGYTSSLAAFGGRVLVQYDDQKGGRFVAFDGQTGQPAWDVKRTVTEAWATPVVVDAGKRLEAIVYGKPYVAAYDPRTGKELWKVEGMEGEVAPSPAFAAGVVFVGTDHSAMVAIQTGGDGKVLWKYEDDLPDVASPVATEKFLIMCSSGGVISCLDAKTGKKVWSKEFDEGFYGSPILVDDRVYVMDRAGVTHVFKAADKYESLAANPLGEKADCTPAIPEGRIYLRSEKRLYCLGKSGT